uniref:Uncharacterized protein n=1 Tax=Chenopodium quinoa TaxID=63459 RepID=A0A803LA08_CHEQI
MTFPAGMRFSPPPIGPSGPLFPDPYGAGYSTWMGCSSQNTQISPIPIPSLVQDLSGVLGSADSPKAPYVSSLVRSFEIEFMFLIETLVPVNVAVDKLSSLAFDGFCGSDALGDFNQVKYLVDKLGGAPSILGRYDFLNWKIASGLVDIPFTGSPFTWTNGQLGNPTFERLDKGYASCSWLESHPDAMVIHRPILFSDHAAIVLKETIPLSPKKTPYRIENWCLDIR